MAPTRFVSPVVILVILILVVGVTVVVVAVFMMEIPSVAHSTTRDTIMSMRAISVFRF